MMTIKLLIPFYLTPLIPLSFKGEGEIKKEGLMPLFNTLSKCSG